MIRSVADVAPTTECRRVEYARWQVEVRVPTARQGKIQAASRLELRWQSLAPELHFNLGNVGFDLHIDNDKPAVVTIMCSGD